MATDLLHGLLGVLIFTTLTTYAQETIPCKVDASLTCGWAYIPPKYDGMSLFPAAIYELEAFPEDGRCSEECLDIIQGPNCKQEKPMLTEACDALQCSVDVLAACGVTKAGKVTWEKACSQECEDAMMSKTCKQTEEIYSEFRRYKESFGPSGSECSTWKCMNKLKDRCSYFDEGRQAMSSRSLCDLACYAEITSDECRLAHVEVLLTDGTLADFSRYVDGGSYGPGSPVCNQPTPEDPYAFLDLLPLATQPPAATEPPRPDCKSVSPFDLCWYIDRLPGDTDPTPAPEPDSEAGSPGVDEESIPGGSGGSPIGPPGSPDTDEDRSSADGKTAVNFVSSMTFKESPDGFPSSPDSLRRRLLQAIKDGPRDVPVPKEWEGDYKSILASYASDPVSGTVINKDNDISVHNISQTFYTSPNGEERVVTLDVDTTVLFEDATRARWFGATIGDSLKEIFRDWGLLFAGTDGSFDPNTLFDENTTQTGNESRSVVPLNVAENPSQPPKDPTGTPVWIYVVAGLCAAALLAVIVMIIVLAARKKQARTDEEALATVGKVASASPLVPAEPNKDIVPVDLEPRSSSLEVACAINPALNRGLVGAEDGGEAPLHGDSSEEPLMLPPPAAAAAACTDMEAVAEDERENQEGLSSTDVVIADEGEASPKVPVPGIGRMGRDTSSSMYRSAGGNL
eukprot:CAMPEP_0117649620 /NCGR_PEP_ID=MMETSP0804-20121206/1075_1 /TAXON_ID=1074897 /ORGANISM="Tetraselmis astigmatica, Strain CCMP880" /LENGTH=683 /DNA_ID=CAMNT_0005455381 /DNA_START=399 /DNA_END=2450 /DNA_ORIENTATION=+